MKKIIIFSIFILLNNCSEYSPTFSSKQINFYIEEIIVREDNRLIRKIVKNLKPYTVRKEKKKIRLILDLELNETVILRDEKGDMASEEIKMILDIKSILPNNEKRNFQFIEKFIINNQSNKFELNQYKKSIRSTMIDEIYEDLILQLRSL